MSSTTTVAPGTVSTSSTGTTYITGTATGLNVTALIQNAVNAKLVPKTNIDAEITANTNKISAMQALQTYASNLEIASQALASDDLLGNVFTAKQLSYATSDGTDASNILTASTSTGAQAGTYKIVVGQLAKTESVASATQASQTTALGYTGTFDIGEAGKTASTISITPTTTLQSLRNQINQTTATSGVSADIIQLGNNQYQLILSSTDTNKAINVSNVTGDDVLQNLGVTNSSQGFVNITQPPQGASITLNNTTVTSDSNNLTNVLTGLNINLVNSAPGTTVTLTSGNNIAGVTDAINTFVTAYNTLQSAISSLQLVDADGTADAGAYLFGDQTTNSLHQQTSALLSQAYGNANSTFNGLYSLGITADDTNLLAVNNQTLSAALQSNYSDVQAVFASNGTTSTGIADQMATLTDSYSNIITGSYAAQISNIQANDVDLQTKSDDIQTQVDAYQTQLINTYAQLEAAYEQADTTKKQILAILNGSSPTSN